MESTSFALKTCNRTHHAPSHSAPGTRYGNCHIRFLSAGHGWYYDGNQRIDLHAGDVLLLDGQAEGHVVCDRNDPYDFIFMNYSGHEARQLSSDIISRHGRLFKIHNKVQIMQLCRRIYHLPEQESRFSLGDALLAELLVLLLDNEESDGAPLHFKLITEYLENYLHCPLSREQVAVHFDVHPLTLDRMCKAHARQTMRQVHEDMRMQLAKSLLHDHQMNVSDVATHIGFDDQFHFSRVFKKSVGKSPKQYQSIIRGN